MLPSKGVVSAGRGKVLQAHYKTPGVTSAAAAATAASNAAGANPCLCQLAQIAVVCESVLCIRGMPGLLCTSQLILSPAAQKELESAFAYAAGNFSSKTAMCLLNGAL